MKYLCVIILFGMAVISCNNEEEKTKEENELMIQEYLLENNLVSESTSSGLHYIIETEGNGMHPIVENDIIIRYVGYNLDGLVFDRSDGDVEFALSALIEGWKEGIPKFSTGGSGILLIPSHLAYSGRSPSFNRPIIFEIELKGFK